MYNLYLIYTIINVLFTHALSNIFFPISGLATASDYISDFIFKTNSTTIGSQVSFNLVTDTIFGDNNLPFKVELIKNNGEVATDRFEFINAFKDDKILPLTDFYINYTNAKNKIYSNVRRGTYDVQYRDNYHSHCQYISNEPKYSDYYFQINQKMTSVKYSFAVFTIIFNTTGVNIVNYSNGTLQMERLDNYLTDKTYALYENLYRNIWIIDQPYLNYTQLVLQRDEDMSLDILNITLKENYEVIVDYDRNIILPEPFNNVTITKVGRKDDILLMSLGEYGIVGLSPNEEVNSFNMLEITGNMTINFKLQRIFVNDFVVNQNTLYVIAKDYGLLIYNLKDFALLNEFKHPNMSRIDFLNNPFTGSKYVGISVFNSQLVPEFFIELLIDNEFSPQVNKVFTSDFLVVPESFYTLDNFFTYLYDRISQNVIAIRRGMINLIPHEVYLLSVYKYTTNFKEVLGVFNNITKSHVPLLSSDKSLLVMDNITFPYDALNCTFKQNGNYLLSFMSKSEVCRNSLVTDYAYSSCFKTISYPFSIQGDEEHTMAAITAIAVSVSVVVAILVALIFWKTDCCKKFDEFVLKKPDMKREALYIENNITHENEEKPEKVGFQFGMQNEDLAYGDVVTRKDEILNKTKGEEENEILTHKVDEKIYNRYKAMNRTNTRRKSNVVAKNNPVLPENIKVNRRNPSQTNLAFEDNDNKEGYNNITPTENFNINTNQENAPIIQNKDKFEDEFK